MELYIFNGELEFQGIVDAYTSFRWVRRFYKVGECELHVELTPKNLELLKLNNFIVKKDDTEPCIITYRNLKLNEDGTEVIVVKGLFAKSILARRIILHTRNFYKKLVTKAFFELLADGIMYGIERRQIINIFMGESEMDPTLTETFTKQISYKNLLESIEEVTRVTGVGTRLDFSVAEKMFHFEMYKPKNRTITQARPVVNKNLLLNSDVEKTGTREYLRYTNLAPIFDKNGIGTYTFSFDLKSVVEGDMQVYYEDTTTSNIKYKWNPPRMVINATTEYKRYSLTVDISVLTETATICNLSFYGIYDTGRIPSVKNVKIEKGSIATDWTPAPEDTEYEDPTNPNPNPVAVFNPEFDNVLEQEFIECNTDVATTAIIGGEGEGTARVVEITGDQYKGLGRREIFVDARDLQKKDANDVIMTDAQYTQLLIARGEKALEECKMVSSFTSKININQSNLIYKKDYDLGDTVTCVNKKWGIKIDTQITEIEEVYENNTKEVYIVFGEELPTIMDKIRRE